MGLSKTVPHGVSWLVNSAGNYCIDSYFEWFTTSLRLAERKRLKALLLKTPIDPPVCFKRNSWAKDGDFQ
jgi:hypothetical protein